ncbi:MAG: hypothetical protein K5793_09315 [Nitrosarchaeum sp.]|nr:hypothetical protein [Nitrosarchaeum sp.]
MLTSSTVYAQTPFRDTSGLTKNGIEWCEENYSLYQLMGNDFFEHHNHSIESRLCGNLYNDEIWTYAELDRYQKLIEKSRIYYALEIQESANEAKEGKIDTKPVIVQEIPQEIAQQQKELEQQQKETEIESKVEIQPKEIPVNNTLSEQRQNNAGGGGCLIATAAYGTELASQVQFLREIRDNKVMSTELGASFMTGFNEFYYSFSPYVADYERENPIFKEIVKVGLVPMLSSLSIMSFAEDDSEEQILAYGIMVVLANLGMYFVAPAVILIKLTRRIT